MNTFNLIPQLFIRSGPALLMLRIGFVVVAAG